MPSTKGLAGLKRWGKELEADVARLSKHLRAVLMRAERYDVFDDEKCDGGVSECPMCWHQQEDIDGVGFVYCEACGHCTHPSLTGDECDVCGEIANAE